ncbi:hypothetical protein [Terrarubrum flagellatum]|uniref:hypothetical protein n=1 Tax=Terrirubrum flagellatum TaxID=2895980 RepID=UPI003144FC47
MTSAAGSLPSGRRRSRFPLLRLSFFLLSSAAAAWAVEVGPASVAGWRVALVGKRIGNGATFDASALAPLLDLKGVNILQSPCTGDVQQGALFIAARLAELALNVGEFAELDGRLEKVETLARETLVCSPHNSFAWFALYWSQGRRVGFTRRTLDYLDMSYRMGPREGWISVRRNPQAMLVYRQLSPELKARLVEEWRLLLEARLFQPAALALAQIPEGDRQTLFDQRARLDSNLWALFSDFLDLQGIDILLPDAPERRRTPWRAG